jgi:hypothetical protein
LVLEITDENSNEKLLLENILPARKLINSNWMTNIKYYVGNVQWKRQQMQKHVAIFLHEKSISMISS